MTLDESKQWSEAEILALVHGCTVVARDEDARPLPLPTFLADAGVQERRQVWTDQLERTDARDRVEVARAWWKAVHGPGEVVSVAIRRREGEGWVRVDIKMLNLLGDPQVGSVLVAASPGTPVPAPDTDEEIDRYHEPVWIVQHLDDVGQILQTEGEVDAVFGRPAQELVGRAVLDLIHPDDQPAAMAMWMELIQHPGSTRAIRQRIVRPDQRAVWLESTVMNRLDDDRLPVVVAVSHDISDRLRQEEELIRRERRFSALAEGMPVGVFIADSEGRLSYSNERWHTLTARFGGAPDLFDVISTDRHDELWAAWRDLTGGDSEDWFERELPAADNQSIFRLRCRRPVGSPDVIGTLDDVTASATLTAELRRGAERDPLTGISNRRGLERHLEAVLADGADGVALLFIDLDQFKDVNDTFGHDVGDLVLVETARRLQRVVRPGDAVARYGGDEFVLLCSSVRDGEEHTIAERLEATLGDPVRWSDGSLRPRASVGAVRPDTGESPAALLRRADTEMYRRKHQRSKASRSV